MPALCPGGRHHLFLPKQETFVSKLILSVVKWTYVMYLFTCTESFSAKICGVSVFLQRLNDLNLVMKKHQTDLSERSSYRILSRIWKTYKIEKLSRLKESEET